MPSVIVKRFTFSGCVCFPDIGSFGEAQEVMQETESVSSEVKAIVADV